MPWNPLWQMPVSTVLFCGWSRRVLGKYGVCTLFVAFLGVFWGAMRSTQRVARWIPPPPNPLNLFSLLIVSLCSFLFTATSLFLLTYLFPIGSDSGDGERRFAPNAPRNSWMLSVDISSLKGALWLRTSYFCRYGQLNRFYRVYGPRSAIRYFQRSYGYIRRLKARSRARFRGFGNGHPYKYLIGRKLSSSSLVIAYYRIHCIRNFSSATPKTSVYKLFWCILQFGTCFVGYSDTSAELETPGNHKYRISLTHTVHWQSRRTR